MTRSLCVALVLTAASAGSYPIPPETIWTMASHSDAIVVATLVEFFDPPANPSSFAAGAMTLRERHSFARLRVLETLKGAPMREVDVITNLGLICPAPPRFVAGKTMVVFLHGAAGVWHVTALSYGTLYPQPEELPVFKALLARAVAVQANAVTEAQRLDWAIEATSRRATRAHGLFELTSEPEDPEKYGRQRRQPKLTVEQQRALATGFIAEPSADDATPTIIAVLAGFETPALEPTLIGSIEALIATQPSSARDAIAAFIERKHGDPAEFLGEPDHEGRPETSDLRGAWHRVRAKYALPAGVKVPRIKRVRDVGEDTP